MVSASGADTPTMRNASRFSIRYSIFSTPCTVMAKRRGGKGDTAAAIQELERRVVTEWLPTSGYEYAEGPDVEVYLDPECTRFEVWIPVAKAKG